MSWRERAACIGQPLNLFYPENDFRVASQHAADPARQVCAWCPVYRECLTEGMADPWGIRAGTTADQRDLVRGRSDAVKILLDWFDGWIEHHIFLDEPLSRKRKFGEGTVKSIQAMLRELVA